MKKIYLFALVLCFAGSSHGDFLDDWMESSATPEYIQTEVKTRKILCYAGSEVSSLPSSKDYSSNGGTVFPSPDPSLIPVVSNEKDKSYSY